MHRRVYNCLQTCINKQTTLLCSLTLSICIPQLGMLSRRSLMNSPSRLASRLHWKRASHVHGSDSSSSSSSSSLITHSRRTARTNSSLSSLWFVRSFFTFSGSTSSLCAKSTHCVSSCAVIHSMILSFPLAPFLFFMLMSSFIVGLETVVITMYVRTNKVMRN